MAVLKAVYIFTLLTVCSAHIPNYYYNWAEPDTPVFVSDSTTNTASRENSLDRLTALRTILQQYGVDAYVIPTADAHNSEYIAPSDARREWISGLSGSSGTAVVTATQALVWTDGRYFTQFYREVNTTYWGLMRMGIDSGIDSWLVSNLTANSVVAIDPTTYTRTSWTNLQTSLSRAQNITLRAIDDNLVDLARISLNEPAPPRPNNTLLLHPVEFSGKPSSEKIADLLSQIASRGASALILTALDDIAYTLNLRGTDIPYNPVFFSYLIIRADVTAPNNVILFWNNGILASDVVQQLSTEGVTLQVRPYSEVFQYVRQMADTLQEGSTIWLSQDGSHAIHLAAEAEGKINILSTVSPVALAKYIKNDVELRGFRSAHVKDGVAVVRALRWVHDQVSTGQNVTEVNLSDKLIEFRSEEEYFRGPSFATIAGAGENGAVIHYAPSPVGDQRVIRADDMLLLDTGAQFRDGTTDITRTRHMSGTPTPAQRNTFTRVLKGQIMLATAVFPKGSTGNLLETLARKFLWDVGLNYAHGTGHGVGHYLNVHEGPSGIGAARMASDPGIVPGTIFSNEPGYYEVDEYGIRHEDLVEVIEMNNEADHIYAAGMVGDFDGVGAVAFRTISLSPHQTACLDVQLLSDDEIKYLNDYHNRVLETLGPILQNRNLTEDYDWLQKECAPIARGSAILYKSTPFLAVLSVFSLWLGH